MIEVIIKDVQHEGFPDGFSSVTAAMARRSGSHDGDVLAEFICCTGPAGAGSIVRGRRVGGGVPDDCLDADQQYGVYLLLLVSRQTTRVGCGDRDCRCRTWGGRQLP